MSGSVQRSSSRSQTQPRHGDDVPGPGSGGLNGRRVDQGSVPGTPAASQHPPEQLQGNQAHEDAQRGPRASRRPIGFDKFYLDIELGKEASVWNEHSYQYEKVTKEQAANELVHLGKPGYWTEHARTLSDWIQRPGGRGGDDSLQRALKHSHDCGQVLGFGLPFGSDQQKIEAAKKEFLDTLNQQPVSLMGRWTRRDLIKKFEEGFTQGKADRLEKQTADAATRAHKLTEHEANLSAWHGIHGKAVASSSEIDNPYRFHIHWPGNWTASRKFIGQADFDARARFALSQVTRFRQQGLLGEDNLDMRPLMYAGTVLAEGCSGAKIRPREAIKLLQALYEAAPKMKPPIGPATLRMVVAGMVAIWGQDTSSKVALDFLSKYQSGAEGYGEAVAEGFGIGMGWKGLHAIDQGVKELNAKKGAEEGAAPTYSTTLYEALREGQAIGKGYLLRLEAALPGFRVAPHQDKSWLPTRLNNKMRDWQKDPVAYDHCKAVCQLRGEYQKYDSAPLRKTGSESSDTVAQTGQHTALHKRKKEKETQVGEGEIDTSDTSDTAFEGMRTRALSASLAEEEHAESDTDESDEALSQIEGRLTSEAYVSDYTLSQPPGETLTAQPRDDGTSTV